MASLDSKNLPTDPNVIREMLLQTLKALEESERDREMLVAYVQELRCRLFGRKSEMLDDGTQKLLGFIQGNLAIKPVSSPKPEEPPPAPKKGHGRAKIPANLPRDIVTHDVPKKDRRCCECRRELIRIGQEESERVEYVPASVHAIRDVRLKYG